MPLSFFSHFALFFRGMDDRDDPVPSGTHIYVTKSNGVTYQHHGIYVGNNRVVHYHGTTKSKAEASIQETTLEVFLQGKSKDTYYFVDHQNSYAPEEIVRRARSRIGQRNYQLWGRNCEHFAQWCATGNGISSQVETVGIAVVAASVVGGILGFILISLSRGVRF